MRAAQPASVSAGTPGASALPADLVARVIQRALVPRGQDDRR